jgi:hypothetical protein
MIESLSSLSAVDSFPACPPPIRTRAPALAAVSIFFFRSQFSP